MRLSDPVTDHSLTVIASGSVPGFVALVSTFSILSKRSSKSSVRFAAQQQRARDAEGRFGAPSEKGNTARFGLGANVTLAGRKIVAHYTIPPEAASRWLSSSTPFSCRQAGAVHPVPGFPHFHGFEPPTTGLSVRFYRYI